MIGSWSKNCNDGFRVTYVFYATGIYSITGNREFLTGHWEKNGNQFVLDARGAHSVEYDVVKLDRNELHLKDSSESDIMVLNKCKEVTHGFREHDST